VAARTEPGEGNGLSAKIDDLKKFRDQRTTAPAQWRSEYGWQVREESREEHKMPNYLLAFHGGGMPETDEARAKETKDWVKWFEGLGPKVVDAGNPVGQVKTIKKDRSIMEGGGANPVTGYSVIMADDIDLAIDLTKDCPVIASGGSVEVCETFAVM
jgi:hypothetical protein